MWFREEEPQGWAGKHSPSQLPVGVREANVISGSEEHAAQPVERHRGWRKQT